MGYVAGKPQKIVRVVDGVQQTLDVLAGEPLPEAPGWPTFKALLNTGFVVWMPDERNAKLPENVPPAVVATAQQNGIAKAARARRAQREVR